MHKKIIPQTLLFLVALGLPVFGVMADKELLKSNAASSDHVQAHLLIAGEGLVKGQAQYLAVQFQMKEGWHIYWENPGESGIPTVITLQTPDGISTGEVLWPYPQRFMQDEIVNFGYAQSVTALVPVTVDADFPESSAQINADIHWLECKDICISASGALAINVPIAEERSPHSGIDVFDRIIKSIPRADGFSLLSAVEADHRVRLELSLPDISADNIAQIEYFPLDDFVGYARGIAFDQDGQKSLIRIEVPLHQGAGRMLKCHGVIVVTAMNNEVKSYRIETDLPVSQSELKEY